jgi:hypothetical protein
LTGHRASRSTRTGSASALPTDLSNRTPPDGVNERTGGTQKGTQSPRQTTYIGGTDRTRPISEMCHSIHGSGHCPYLAGKGVGGSNPLSSTQELNSELLLGAAECQGFRVSDYRTDHLLGSESVVTPTCTHRGKSEIACILLAGRPDPDVLSNKQCAWRSA